MPRAILLVRRSANSIYERRLQQESFENFNLRGLNASRSPPHPPLKEAVILDRAQKGL